MNDIIISLIGAGASIFASVLTLVGVLITNFKSNKKIAQDLEVTLAVSDTKIDELTREVREHNNFAKRMPVLEEQMKTVKENIEELKAYHRAI